MKFICLFVFVQMFLCFSLEANSIFYSNEKKNQESKGYNTMAQKNKKKNFKVQIINVKLLSDKRKGNDAYKEILVRINSNKISAPVRGGKTAILRTLWEEKYSYNNCYYDILYGKLSKFTLIDRERKWLNFETMNSENVDIPKNMFPNLVETDYVFIPAIHRLIIITTKNININAVEQFLNIAIPQVIESYEDYEVCIEQSQDIFEKITQAEEIHKLSISISYTNADTGDDDFDFMDEQLKISNAGRLSMDILPDHTKNINLCSIFISGALKVAKSNGFAKATIKNNDGRKTKIDTKLHPETIPFESKETEVRSNIIDIAMNLFGKRNDV